MLGLGLPVEETEGEAEAVPVARGRWKVLLDPVAKPLPCDWVPVAVG